MAHVIHSINSTINGCCDAEYAVADEEHHAYATRLVESSDALLFGRHSFDLLEAFWPAAVRRLDLPDYMVKFAQAIEPVKKYVSSSKSLSTEWPNCTLVSGDIRLSIGSIRAGHSGTITIFGSPSLGRSLTEVNEIDEFHVLLQPMAIDRGAKLFGGLSELKKLPLIDVETFTSGVILARYGRGA